MDTPAVRNQNPGNLRNPTTGGFQSFSDPIEGKAALYNDLTSKMTGTSTTGLNGQSSLLDFARKYAPREDKNDPEQYAANLANKLGVSPDTPIGTLMPRIDDFASAVASNEDPSAKYTPTSGFNPKPFSNPSGGNPGAVDYSGTTQTQTTQPDNSLGGQISSRVNDLSGAITDTTTGKINPLSGVIQGAGAVAGGVGDVVNAGLELIPGVKQLEGGLGSILQKVAQTPGGQQVVKSVQDFSQAHPELSKDINAGINIVSAIPILKGLGVAKNVVMDVASQALKGTAERAATEGLTKTVARTVGGRTAMKSAPDAVKTLVQERALPNIEDGKFATKDAFDTLSQQISDIEDNKLQPTLARVSTNAVADRQPLEALKQQAIADIKREFKGSGDSLQAVKEIERKFKSYQAEYGDYVTLQDVNDMKRLVRKGVNFNSPQVVSDTAYQLGQTFMKNIEDQATKLGLGDVHSINAEMQSLIKAQNMLKYIEGKPVKGGLLGDFIKTGAAAGGETLGNMTGIPFAGAYMGYKGGGLVGNKIAGIGNAILNRTGKNAVTTSLSSVPKKVTGLLGGALVNKSNNTSR